MDIYCINIYSTIQKFGVGKIFEMFLKVSVAEFFYLKKKKKR